MSLLQTIVLKAEYCLLNWAMNVSDRTASRMSEGSSGRLLEGDEAAVTMLDVLQDEQELEDDANVRDDFILCNIKEIVSRDIYTFLKDCKLKSVLFLYALMVFNF